MMKSWEVSLLVYDYLQKSGYAETSSSFNKECVHLQITDPPPNIFTCVLEKIISCGDLEFRLKSFEENLGKAEVESEKIACLEKEVSTIRKRLKKRKKEHSRNENKRKHQKLSHSKVDNAQHSLMYNGSPQTLNNTAVLHQTNNSSYCTDSQMTLYNSSLINSSQFTDFQSDSILHSSMMPPQISNSSLDKYTLNEGSGGGRCTPEKRLSSSSRRKTATPKKLPCKIQGSIQTLTDNINAKNEEAALDTLNSAEPWLEQFIASLNEPASDGPEITLPYDDDNNKEAALSLLALNQSAETESRSTMSQLANMLQSPTLETGRISNDQQTTTSVSVANMLDVAQLSSGIAVPTSTNTVSNATVNIHLSEQPRSSSTTPQLSESNVDTVCASSSVPSPATTTAYIVGSTAAVPSTAAPVTLSSLIPSKPPSTTRNMVFDPILIKNKKTLSISQNNPNLEVIVLPAVMQPLYQHILPKPIVTVPEPTPTSFHCTQNTAAPVYNFVATKPTPQQEAQKFFGQMRRPYHQQLSRIDQLYLVDTTPVSTTKRCTFPTSVDAIPVQNQYKASSEPGASKPESSSTPEPSANPELSSNPESKAESSFVSWDQKIRQSISSTLDFKPPLPPSGEKKKKRKSKVKDETKEHPDDKLPKKEKSSKKEKNGEKSSKKKKKSSKKEGGKKSSKTKSKRKKKKDDTDADLSKKKVITPEFVEESLSSADENDSLIVRHRQFSESDSVMADMLQKSLKKSPGNSQFSTDKEKCSTPLNSEPLVPFYLNETPVSTKFLHNTKTTPTFIEENANSSFDINESTRPKPVFVPEKSQNSCSCSSNHYRESFIKCPEKAFSFKDQDAADSPKYYNENSTVTVATLFPTLSSSSVSCSPKNNITVSDKQYRSPRLEEDSENEGEDRESDDEVRETTSKLPPLSSQNKDLLESSDEEQEGGAANQPDLIPSQQLFINLSESDNDSTSKFQSPIKSAKFKLADSKTNTPTKQKEVPKFKPADSKTNVTLTKQKKVPKKAVIVEEEVLDKSAEYVEEEADVLDESTELYAEEEEADVLEESTGYVEEEVLDYSAEEVDKSAESDQTVEVDIASAICIEAVTEADYNDSQELVIDSTVETNQPTEISEETAVPVNPQDVEKRVSCSPENNENLNGNIPEDSCDQWYQSVTNKIKAKIQTQIQTQNSNQNSNPIQFTCERCKKTFPSLAVLTVHTDSCSRKDLVCSYCGRKCTSKSGLTNHKKSCLTPKSKEKRKTPSSENKIKINKVSPKAGSSSSSKYDSSKKPLKKKKNRTGKYGDKEIELLLDNLRYTVPTVP